MQNSNEEKLWQHKPNSLILYPQNLPSTFDVNKFGKAFHVRILHYTILYVTTTHHTIHKQHQAQTE